MALGGSNGSNSRTSDGPSTEAIRTDLVSSLGVNPSREWLRACVDHLQQNIRRNANSHSHRPVTVTVDDVLAQVLFSDLRDVVRPVASSTLDGDFTTAQALAQNHHEVFLPSRQLRESIRSSRQANHNYQQSLPESFALLCQLEEAVDVAKSAEQRLGHAQQQQQPQYGPRGGSSARCCKVCLSDGYESGNGNSTEPTPTLSSSASFYMEGIESLPIQGLSPSSLAGCKILLKGPLELRHGILVLHPGNCVVLGGCCPGWVDHQTQARLEAQKQAGVGVDPTVRALIGSSGLYEATETMEQDDEAHEASGDVVVAAANPPPQNPPRNPPRNHPQSRSITSTTHPRNNDRISSSNNNNTQNGRSPLAAGRKRNASQISNLHHPSRGEQQPTSVQNSTRSSSSSTAFQHGTATRNPYTSGGGTSTATVNPYQRSGQQPQRQNQQQQVPPPPQRQRTGIPGSAEPETSNSTAAARITPIANNHQTIRTNYNHSTRETTVSSSSVAPLESRKPQSPKASMSAANSQVSAPSSPHFLYTPAAAAPAPALANSTKNIVQKMSFANLRKLLLELVGNKDMYESYFQRKITFAVELSVPDQTKYDFNVVKVPKHNTKHGKSPAKKNKKKYEYFTSARFGGTHSSSQGHCLACRIHPDLLDSCFEVSANELRALSRTDRPRCTSITNGGGDTVRNTYFAPRVWGATLHLDTHQVFGEATDAQQQDSEGRLGDLKKPILLLGNDPSSSSSS